MSTLVSKISELDILNSTVRISTVDLSNDREHLLVTLNTGLQIKTPLSLYPRLLHASTEIIRDYQLIGKGMGVHWEEPDEDLSLKGFLQDAQVDFGKLKEEAKGVTLNVTAAKQASQVMRAINHGLRQQILSVISQNPGITVTAIYTRLKLEQSVASQHLAILRRAKVVFSKRDGKSIRYHLNHSRIEAVNQAMNLLAA